MQLEIALYFHDMQAIREHNIALYPAMKPVSPARHIGAGETGIFYYLVRPNFSVNSATKLRGNCGMVVTQPI